MLPELRPFPHRFTYRYIVVNKSRLGRQRIGAEYLAWNFAVIDVGGMALYLRHPDSR
jgi:hypothetical protein